MGYSVTIFVRFKSGFGRGKGIRFGLGLGYVLCGIRGYGLG